MKLRGSVEDVREEASPFPFLTRRRIVFKGYPSAIAHFDERWNKTISALSIGDVISVVGKIKYVSTNHIKLHRCEIVEVGTDGEADQATSPQNFVRYRVRKWTE